MRLAIIANYPSYHDVDLFNELDREAGVELKVFYLRRMTPDRQWSTLRSITHTHQFIREWRWHPHFYLSPGLATAVDAFRPDVLLITQYASLGMQWMMYRNIVKRRSWIFWSEAPGITYTELPIFKSDRLRKAARRLALLPLRLARPAEVWGIGERAKNLYAQSSDASARDVPYYSSQTAFRAISRGPVTLPVRFLYAGKLNYRKGFDLLIEAVARVASTRSDFQMVIMGDGPGKILVERLPSAARELVHLTGFKQLSDVPAVFAECDVLLMPSRYDGWGMVVVEAMAAGMPVIASSEAASARALLDHDVTGQLLNELNGRSLASAMSTFLDAPERIRSMGARARQRVACVTAEVGARVFADLVKRVATADGR